MSDAPGPTLPPDRRMFVFCSASCSFVFAGSFSSHDLVFPFFCRSLFFLLWVCFSSVSCLSHVGTLSSADTCDDEVG
ncbi:hypothetical protein BO94DRAFT_368774 [Aspergillus sclerotioniger CBS 115572]|uniref:Uncharacterized protein n=1 Tax=Aspergillus sclerotioniger CBS 115572 TaxID=1450535 RepID=A0A317X8R0_9EURO|nr:hypothetical protein BO94DRAFT_368774 [Aspergillus sclerotioniger CBS 115572]PWY93288.1 hypothetical protein BO94DRAFT_368774 [Aspergillus sclerotioniger CBS 115572]